MPCIKKDRTYPDQHIWTSYCGKTLYMLNRAYEDLADARNYKEKWGKPICRKCNRLATAVEEWGS